MVKAVLQWLMDYRLKTGDNIKLCVLPASPCNLSKFTVTILSTVQKWDETGNLRFSR